MTDPLSDAINKAVTPSARNANPTAKRDASPRHAEREQAAQKPAAQETAARENTAQEPAAGKVPAGERAAGEHAAGERPAGERAAQAVDEVVNPGLLTGDGEVEPIVEPGSDRAQRPAFDRERAEAAIRELLIAVGEDPDREGLEETPARVARAYEEVFAGLHVDPTTVLEKTFAENHQELVLVRDVPIYSTCEHHLVPFYGVAHIGYIPGPDGKVTGLSKLARLADMYAKRPQVQERLTRQVADALVDKLNAQSVIVVIECEHLCMAMRGIRKPGATTTTSAVRGGFKRNAASRAEVLSLIRG